MSPAAARRRARDDGPRPDPAALPGVGAPADAPAARRQVPRGALLLRRRLRQLGVHRRATSRRAGYARERVRVVYPGVDERFSPEGERADLGRPYAFTVATLEPRKNLDTPQPRRSACSTATRRSRSPAAAGWGPTPALDDDGIVRLGFVAARRASAPVPRGRRLRLPVAVRGLRDARRRVDGVRDPGGRVRASRRSTRRAATRPCASTRRSRGDRRWNRGGAPRADELVPRGLEHARTFTWRAVGETMVDAYTRVGSKMGAR